ncbi:unnamed protein product [Caenorhabditis auriculariae]|uniref:Lipid-binding serum glycoprotein C-terminal domain-containing protein n=1 Tax=Caenorhabditis auriculariae TaxID=2777116 RepID=A0A8S1HT43_9PELO|nr:unnamed protein product [Caenorhabditis auriculariae]
MWATILIAVCAVAYAQKTGVEIGTSPTSGNSNEQSFNPALQGGSRENPGIKARINRKGFDEASHLLGSVLNQQIQNTPIPTISECVPAVSGCLQIYNLYVSRYRCPQKISVHPAPPNRLVLEVKNVDLGVTGNLGGQVTILAPIGLYGVVQLNAFQSSIKVELGIERSANGGPALRVVNCHVRIGYADVYVENGGFISQIVNGNFRDPIIRKVKKMAPKQLCGAIPRLIDDKVNSKLSELPRDVEVSKMLELFGGALGLGMDGGKNECSKVCEKISEQQKFIAARSPVTQQKSVVRASGFNQNLPRNAAPLPKIRDYRAIQHQVPASPQRVIFAHSSRAKRAAVAQKLYLNKLEKVAPKIPKSAHGIPQLKRSPMKSSSSHVRVARQKEECDKCKEKNPASILEQFGIKLETDKLKDLSLGVEVKNAYASNNDFVIELDGGFKTKGQADTPFGAFPLQFPSPSDNHMVELLVSDYTVNSLFYQLHNKKFLTFKIGSDTPKIGELLKTTCSDDDDELEPTEVELDDKENRRHRRFSMSSTSKLKLKREVELIRPQRAVNASKPMVATISKKQKRDSRTRRQDDTSGLADLGICFGDILPAIREKYPDKKIAIEIHTTRAPSIILSSSQGGSATLDLAADADIYIDGTDNRVGTLSIAATVELVVKLENEKLTGKAEIKTIKLKDSRQTLGLPQDALDNLANLGKELLQKVANDGLKKGLPFKLPKDLPLPIGIEHPDLKIVEHGLYIAADLQLSSSKLSSLIGVEDTGNNICQQ